jgi:hypothetical protein
MGLNVSAYGRLEAIKDNQVEFGDHGIPVNERIVSLFNNPDYPYHISGLKESRFFICKGETYQFRAGSYHSYSDWRDWLAKLAGYKDAHEVWQNPTMGPFVELINFSNLAGTIGPSVSAKLANDFKDFEHKVKQYEKSDPFHYRAFQDWKKCFEIATKDGAVNFR